MDDAAGVSRSGKEAEIARTTLLHDMQRVQADGGANYAVRMERLERQAELLRQLLQSNERVVLGATDARDEPDAGRGNP